MQFLRSVVIKCYWASIPLRNVITKKYHFHSSATPLHESIQVDQNLNKRKGTEASGSSCEEQLSTFLSEKWTPSKLCVQLWI